MGSADWLSARAQTTQAESTLEQDERRQLLLEFSNHPALAHQVLFRHRHPDVTPPFHVDIIKLWHSPAPRVLTMAFRGAGKSTLAEEALIIMSAFGEFKNCIIIGENEARAVDRLRSIKHELDYNDKLRTLFEIEQGEIWQETRLTLSNGTMLQAYGRGQSLRGAKYLDNRPDMIFLDDVEDEESVRSDETRNKVAQYFTGTVIPALTPGGRIRMAATPLDPKALAPTLAKDPGWITRVYPILRQASGGAPEATWPERFPLPWVAARRAEMTRLGQGTGFMQEYMCQAVDPESKVFKADMIKVEPLVRSWHSVYAMYDPARTIKLTSATTGWVVFSWIRNRLIVWDAGASRWLPDEIVNHMFEINDAYTPTAVGIEETGLNEFLLQPIRQQALLRHSTLPLRPLHAPRGKLDFIRGLQPFFRAGEVIFARELPELRDQLLGFPTGDIDAPNALAYALRMRPGAPVYENFGQEHIVDALPIRRQSPLWLAVNSNGSFTAAALVQMVDGVLAVFADWLREGPPPVVLPHMVEEASLIAGARFRLIAPLDHWLPSNLAGLRQTVARLPAELTKGGDIRAGREQLRKQVSTLAHGETALRVLREASWTCRALAGGYCREVDKRTGVLLEQPEDNAYTVLMEGLESFAGLLRAHVDTRDDGAIQYRYTDDGRRFISARV